MSYPDPMRADSENQRFLERPRVDRLLEKALQSHVVTVVAGEGSGKTLAVHSLLQKKNLPIIWVQISERDNLGWRFWENYTGEVAHVNPEAAKMFTDIGFPESDRQFDRYLNYMESILVGKERYIIVFDDFHLLANSSVLRHLERALVPPVLTDTIVFVSRREPAINLMHLLAKGFVAQVTADDLQFTMEETEDFFRLHDVSLEKAELDRIFRETEGWALALSLILQGIKADNAGRRWDQVIQPVRKMEESIFSTMEAELQKFLVKLSLIEHWPRNLLERLEPGGKNIAAMEQFSSVIRFDVYLHGFRIHHLFLEFLREKQQYLSRDEIREVYDKDARWCIEHHLPTDAAVNYERAGDFEGFIRLVESLPRMLPRPMASFFLEIVERLTAKKDSLREGEEDWDFLFLRFIIRARFLALLDRFEEAAGGFRAGIACFEAKPPGPRRSRALAAAYNRLGILCVFMSRFTGDYDFAHWFERGYLYYLENPEPVQEQTGQLNVSSYAIQVGFPSGTEAIDAFINACAAIVPYTSVSLGGYFFGGDTLARAELAYYRGDLNKAEQFARQAMYQSREKKQYEVETRTLSYLLRISAHRGDTASVREIERQLEALLERDEYINRYVIHDLIMGRFYSRIGLTEKVAPWIKKEREEGDLNVLFRGFDTLIKVRCLFAEKEYPAALEALDREKTKGEVGTFLLGFLETTVMEAAIRYRLGDSEGAFAALKNTYDAARPNGLNMPFVELGEHMYSLTGALLKAHPDGLGISPEWLQTIRRNASAHAKKRALVKAQYSGRETPAPVDFSQHELAILNSISQGYTSKEIAGDMRISVKMIKSAIRSLYVKLGAANRAGAIRVATERGLLQVRE